MRVRSRFTQDSRPGVFSVVPAGLVLLSHLNPGLRPGLLSAVPSGLCCDRSNEIRLNAFVHKTRCSGFSNCDRWATHHFRPCTLWRTLAPVPFLLGSAMTQNPAGPVPIHRDG